MAGGLCGGRAQRHHGRVIRRGNSIATVSAAAAVCAPVLRKRGPCGASAGGAGGGSLPSEPPAREDLERRKPAAQAHAARRHAKADSARRPRPGPWPCRRS